MLIKISHLLPRFASVMPDSDFENISDCEQRKVRNVVKVMIRDLKGFPCQFNKFAYCV